MAADQIGQQCRQVIVLTVQPVVLDRHVLAFDSAGFVEAFAEPGRIAHGAIRRPAIDKPDQRQRRLLRARHERPCGCRTAERGYELPPSDAACHSPRPERDHARCNMGEEYHASKWRSGRFRVRYRRRFCRAALWPARRFMTHDATRHSKLTHCERLVA